MPLRKAIKGLPLPNLPAEGILNEDLEALTHCQRECIGRVGISIELEHESYLTRHPEVKALLENFVSKMVKSNKRKGILKEAADYFTRPVEDIDLEVRQNLGLKESEPYVKTQKPPYNFVDEDLKEDLKKIINAHYPPEPYRIPTSSSGTPDTLSSSFLSIKTSATTVPTPEPIPTPDPTLSETLFNLVSNTVDKSIFLHVDDRSLRYDTAYVELSKAVEEAMELTVVDIKEEIADLYFNAYKLFEIDIMEKERIAAEIAWEKRMRKKMKRTLRRLDNFKGYEPPSTPKSVLSSHESYKKPPPRPCICHPQFKYNRYPKDRFGIYLPRDMKFSRANVTVTPAISLEDVAADGNQATEGVDTKSIISKKSATSTKSGVSKKATFKE